MATGEVQLEVRAERTDPFLMPRTSSNLTLATGRVKRKRQKEQGREVAFMQASSVAVLHLRTSVSGHCASIQGVKQAGSAISETKICLSSFLKLHWSSVTSAVEFLFHHRQADAHVPLDWY